MTIKFQRDNLGMVDWAFLPDSVFALARFQSTGTIHLVATPTQMGGRFIRMDNPKYDYAETYADFKRKAQAFQDESTS
jgi:hypothetical protein